MNLKTTYILFGILAGILFIFGIALYMGDKPEDTSTLVLPSVKDPLAPIRTDQITEVEIERDKPKPAKWVFVKDEATGNWTIKVFVKDEATGNWTIKEPREMRASSMAITSLIDQVLRADREKTTEKPAKLEDWGLKFPNLTVTLKRDKGKPLQIMLGDTQMSNVYVLSSDRGQEPMIVKKNRLDKVEQDLAAFRERDMLTSRESDIQSISLSQTDKGKEKGKPIELVKRNEHWYYTKPFNGDADREGDTNAAPAGQPPSGTQGLLTDLTNLRVEKDIDFVADDVKESDLAKYNLDDKSDILKIEIKRVDEITKTTEPGEAKKDADVKTSTITLLVGVGKKVDDKSDQYYARRAGEKDVVKIAAKNIEPLLKLLEQPDALRDRHLVRLDSFRQPDAINIDLKSSGLVMEFRHPESGKPWQFYRGSQEEKPNEEMIKGLITILTDRRKEIIFLDPDKSKDAELGLDKPAAVVSLWVDGLVKEEKKDDTKDEEKDKDAKKVEKPEEKKAAKPTLKMPEKPTYRLTFALLKDAKATEVVVKREAEGEKPALLRVPVVVYERVTEGPLAYMDKTLPQFNPVALGDPGKDVTKLVYEQGGTTTEITREKPEAPWKIVKPADLAGRDADPLTVSRLLHTLNNLRAVKLVTEQTSKEDLDRKYGLATPAARAVVTVTKDGKPTTYEFDFGKKDGTSLYAKQSQRGTIFTVDESTLASFKDPILDKTVFHFDPTKVTALTLTGWSKIVGDPITIKLEHKDGKEWVGRKDLDQTKVNNLVRDLSDLRAEKFLAHKSQPKPEQELDVAKGGLRIEIKIEGEKEPLVLTLGKAEADGYVATSSKLSGDIFLVPKATFEGVMSKPAYFNP